MTELGLSVVQLAEKAEVHPATIRAFLRGDRWPRQATRDRIVAALDWDPQEVVRRVWGGRVALTDASTEDLLGELCRRFNQDHHVRQV